MSSKFQPHHHKEMNELKKIVDYDELLIQQEMLHLQQTELQKQWQIIEEKKDELAKSENRFFKFMENIPMGIFIIDAEGKPYYANKKAVEINGSGINPEADLKVTYQAKIAGTNEDYPHEKKPILQALKGNAVHIDDLELVNGDHRVPVEVNSCPIFDENGKVEYAISVFQDISERRTWEATLQQKNEELRTIEEELRQNMDEVRAQRDFIEGNEKRLFKILESIPAGVFVVQANGKPYFANFQAKELLGKGIINDSNDNLAQVYQAKLECSDEDYPIDKMPIIKALQGESSAISDMEILRAEERVLLEVTASPIKNENNEIEYAVAIFQDIREKRQKELDIQHKNEELLATEEELRQNMEELQAIHETMESKQLEIETFNSRLKSNEAILKKAVQKLKENQIEIETKNQALINTESELRQNMEELQAIQEIMEHKQEELEVQQLALEGANKLLTSKNNTITDSIIYAERIQHAILPSKTDWQKHFEEHFVIYQPKDIVSGDFYWCNHIENKTYVAVVDCTGHGVPGAFMSLIGNSLLNQIVNEKRVFQTDKILEYLHLEIRNALKQKDTSNYDGMDLSLICIERLDNQQVRIQFSGAKSSIFYYHQNTLHELKGDRKGIGGFQHEVYRTFTAQTVVLEAKDTIYLTSDGFIDAPSPKRLRFSNQKLKEIIAQVQTVSLNEQKQIFLEALQNHSQDTLQRDDITLVGIKV